MRRVAAAGALLVLAATFRPAGAQCAGVRTPDGRASFSACPGAGSIELFGNTGAYAYDNAIAAGASGVSATNVPGIGGAVSFGPSGPALDNFEPFGPTAIQSSLGSGGLTAGLTNDGTVAVLSWPNPGYFNQMLYLTTARGQPRAGAADNHGAFAGLDYALPYGRRAFSWLRDWPSTQRYVSGDSDALVTTFRRKAITVSQTAVVSPSRDVLAIRFRVTGATDPRIVFFENLNPGNHKIPWLPGHDQLLWQLNDFGAMWQPGAILHFRPADADPGRFLNVVTGSADAASQNLGDDLRASAQPGVAFAVTSRPRPIAHQVGVDALGVLREGSPDLGGEDAYYDASARGARLSGANAAFGQVDSAIAVPTRAGVADVIIGAASTNDAASSLASMTHFDDAYAASRRYRRAWLARAALPRRSADLDVDRRALIAIDNASAPSGAIVASIARQSPYAEDWVRDGAFFNYALDLAGHPEMVDRHNRFYARVQRANGTWGTMYYTDGEEGGPYLYESDQQGLGAWTLWQHYVMHPSRAYLDAVYPAIARVAESMTAYANPSNGRQGLGMEDDNVFPSDGLQGAVAQWTGLSSAVQAASLRGDESSAQRWSQRAGTLKRSILSEYFDARGRYAPGSPGYPQHLGFRSDPGAAAWMVWPAGLLDPSVRRERAMLRSVAAFLYDDVSSLIPSGAVLSYQQKQIQALAVYLGMGLTLPGRRDPSCVAQWVDFYHRVLPTSTLHFGEQIWQGRKGQWVNRIDMPHVWSGVLVYLDAISLTRPELTPYRPWLLRR